MNPSLVDTIKSCANSDGLPIIPSDTWKQMNDVYTKQEIKDALAYYIVNNHPKFPVREIEESVAANKFNKLCKQNISDFILDKTDTVFEKYDDYKYSFK